MLLADGGPDGSLFGEGVSCLQLLSVLDEFGEEGVIDPSLNKYPSAV